MKFQTTRPFDRDYARLPSQIKQQADKQLALLLSNLRHPSLRLKRIQGTSDLWEARITRSYRLTVLITGDAYVLRRIGTHDVLRES